MKRSLRYAGTAVLAVVVGVWGCTRGEAETEAAETAAPNPAVHEAVSPSGVPIELSVDPYPMRVGDVGFHITFGVAVPDSTPVSIDIVSPDMPMMGIRRYAAERMANGKYMVTAPIMMDGLWDIYVNLGSGADAAEFELEAQPSDDGSGHQHGGSAGDSASKGEAGDRTGHEQHGDHG